MQIDIPGYKIISTLGQGGMATVYLAIQSSFEREVALKVMSPNLSTDPSFGERFLREARIVSRLVHPNIVTVYDVGVHENLHYLSMEYLPGQDLKHKHFELNLIKSLRVIKDIARALDYAGRKGYVHRDVKPENIMLHDEDGRAVLMDFGIARPADVASGMTQTGTAIGTPHYMSPEQAKGGVVDSRADLYGLGVVLFVLLTGHVPYDADSAVVVGIKHVSDPIPQLPEYLSVFQPIIDKILAKDPDVRYQTGGELVADLDTIPHEKIIAIMKAKEAPLIVDGTDESSPTMISKIPVALDKTTISSVNAAVPDPIKKSSVHVERSPASARVSPSAHLSTSPRISADAPVKVTGENRPADLLKPDRPRTKPIRNSNEERFTVSAEDRAGYHANNERVDEKKSGSWVLLFLLAGIIGGLFYFRDDLRSQWQKYTDPTIEQDPSKTLDVISMDNAESQSPATSDSAQGSATPSSTPASIESTETPVTAKPETTSSNLLQQAQALKEKLKTDINAATDLAAIYRTALQSSNSSERQAAEQGLDDLQNYFAVRIETASAEGQQERVQELTASANLLFSEGQRNSKLAAVLTNLKDSDPETLALQRAKDFIAADALTSPKGQNALEIYQSILAKNPDNSAAKQGIESIAERYAQLAKHQETRGNLTAAIGLTEKGLALSATNAQLIAQQNSYTAQLRQQQQEEKVLLEKAQAQFDAGQLIIPADSNALDTYRAILARNSGNAQAQEGVKQIERALIIHIEELLDQQRWTEANSEIASAQNQFPQSQTLLALKLRAEQLFEDSKPVIERVLVSSAEITNLDLPENKTIAADRVVYIGFEYRNFKEGTSVLQAVLYDGSRSLQIAQVPVIIDGKSGTQFFRIEQAVNGFSEGGYIVDLVLEKQTLKTISFSVKK